MEKEKKSKIPVVSSVLLVICAIIICFMAYYINKLLVDRECLTSLTDDQSAMIEEINNNNNNNNNSKDVEKTEEKESSSYEDFIENFKEARKTSMNEDTYVYEYLGSEERKYELPGVLEVRLNNKGEVHLIFDEKSNLVKTYGKDYTLEKDVFTFEVCPYGNGGYASLIILKEDGTCKSLDGIKLEQTGKINLETLDIKNVIHIEKFLYEDPEGGGATGYCLYDMEGNTLTD